LIVQALSAVYGAAATWRRRWYARDPRRTRRLGQPVISVGNLRVGGSGKTPVVACLARLLLARGERPAILSRGYGRASVDGGVTVVSDGARVLSDLAHAGDEPLLLARTLPGVPVLVCPDRHAAGELAEARFGTTVHLLDDGFQHLRLARDLDLLLVDPSDLEDHVMPAGRLREPLENARLADAVLVAAPMLADAAAVGARLGVAASFQVVRALGAPIAFGGAAAQLDRERPVYALAGIARPERFFGDLRASGWTVSATRTFRDHHRFSQRDVAAIAAAAQASGAHAVLTTEKDAVRLEGLDLGPLPWAAAPLETSIEPATRFVEWVLDRLEATRREVRTRSGSGRTRETAQP
jgi:tetraacyldisaccharide 4'-kinase